MKKFIFRSFGNPINALVVTTPAMFKTEFLIANVITSSPPIECPYKYKGRSLFDCLISTWMSWCNSSIVDAPRGPPEYLILKKKKLKIMNKVVEKNNLSSNSYKVTRILVGQWVALRILPWRVDLQSARLLGEVEVRCERWRLSGSYVEEAARVFTETVDDTDGCLLDCEWLKFGVVESQLFPWSVHISSDYRVIFACEFADKFVSVFIEDLIDVVVQILLLGNGFLELLCSFFFSHLLELLNKILRFLLLSQTNPFIIISKSWEKQKNNDAFCYALAISAQWMLLILHILPIPNYLNKSKLFLSLIFLIFPQCKLPIIQLFDNSNDKMIRLFELRICFMHTRRNSHIASSQ